MSEQSIDPGKELVIVLEDSPPNQNILKRILEKCGFQVLTGESGIKGIEHLDRCEKDKLNLVLIISDIMMPKMDGHRFLEHVRKQSSFKNVPVLFATAMNDKQNVIEARKHGINGYLLKPLTMEKVQEKIMELFPDHEFPFSTAS